MDQIGSEYFRPGTPDEDDIGRLINSFRSDMVGMSEYNDRSFDAYRLRRSIWPNKSHNLTKDYDNAFPFPGASDQEVRLAEWCIQGYVSLFMNAMKRSSIRVTPTEANDVKKARVLQDFMKYLRDSYIPNFTREMRIVAEYGCEKGIFAAAVNWRSKPTKQTRILDLENIASVMPEFAQRIIDNADDDLVTEFADAMGGISLRQSRKALKELREKGITEVVRIVREYRCPNVRALRPDYDIIFGGDGRYDVQAMSQVSIRYFLPVAELESFAESEEWDSKFTQYVVNNLKGHISQTLKGAGRNTSSTGTGMARYRYQPAHDTDSELVEIVYTYRRLWDKETKTEAVYETVYSPHYSERVAKHGLYGSQFYPVHVERWDESSDSMFDVTTLCDTLKGPQWQAKYIRDGWTDQQSQAISPTIIHPPGRAEDVQYGANGRISARINDRFEFFQPRSTVATDIQTEKYVIETARMMVGLDNEDPISQSIQQMRINQFLAFVGGVLKLAFNLFRDFGDDEMYFRITNQSEPTLFVRDEFNIDVDVNLDFDIAMNNPDTMKERFNAFMQLVTTDTERVFNRREILTFGANMIDPNMAEASINSPEVSEAEIIDKVTDDISKIMNGIGQGAREGMANLAIRVIDEYASIPRNAQVLASDPTVADLLGEYRAEYQQELDQQENAIIGREGGLAKMGEIITQGTNVGE